MRGCRCWPRCSRRPRSRWRRRRDAPAPLPPAAPPPIVDDLSPAAQVGPAAVLRHVALGVRADVVRDLSRSAVTRTARRTISPCSSAARRCRTAGTRAVPSLRYQEYTPPYADLLDNPDGISAPGPGGGLTQDGRAPTLADQARIPLLAANEMANTGPADVVRKIQASAYAALFRAGVRRAASSTTPSAAFRKALEALQAFQLEDSELSSVQQQVRSLRQQQDRRHAHAGGAARLRASTTIRRRATASPATTTAPA